MSSSHVFSKSLIKKPIFYNNRIVKYVCNQTSSAKMHTAVNPLVQAQTKLYSSSSWQKIVAKHSLSLTSRGMGVKSKAGEGTERSPTQYTPKYLPTDLTFKKVLVSDLDILQELWHIATKHDPLTNPLARKVSIHHPFVLSNGGCLPRLDLQFLRFTTSSSEATYSQYLYDHLHYCRIKYKEALVVALSPVFDPLSFSSEFRQPLPSHITSNPSAFSCQYGFELVKPVAVPSSEIPRPMTPEEYYQRVEKDRQEALAMSDDTIKCDEYKYSPQPVIYVMPSMSHSANVAIPDYKFDDAVYNSHFNAHVNTDLNTSYSDSETDPVPTSGKPIYKAGWWQQIVCHLPYNNITQSAPATTAYDILNRISKNNPNSSISSHFKSKMELPQLGVGVDGLGLEETHLPGDISSEHLASIRASYRNTINAISPGVGVGPNIGNSYSNKVDLLPGSTPRSLEAGVDHHVGLDTDSFIIVCGSPIGGPYHSSSPRSINPRFLLNTQLPLPVENDDSCVDVDQSLRESLRRSCPSSLRYGGLFPIISPIDQSNAHLWTLKVLDYLDITHKSDHSSTDHSASLCATLCETSELFHPHECIEVLADIPTLVLPPESSATMKYIAANMISIPHTIGFNHDYVKHLDNSSKSLGSDSIVNADHLGRANRDMNTGLPLCHMMNQSPLQDSKSDSVKSPKPKVKKSSNRFTPADVSPRHLDAYMSVASKKGVSLHGLIGSSMGGMQVLTFASLYPALFRRVAAMCTTAQTSPSTVAIRSIQRHAVRQDENWNNGLYADEKPPKNGLGLARMVGTIAYRSKEEFDQRFDWRPDSQNHFEVENYLSHQADSFKNSFDANCYLCLSQCMDLTDISQVTGQYDSAAARIGDKDTQLMLLSVIQDALIPHEQMAKLAEVLGRQGLPLHYEALNSLLGHDAFLVEHRVFGPRLAHFFAPEVADGVMGVRRYTRELEDC